MANAEADDYDLNCEHDVAEGDYSGNVRRPMNAFLIFCKRHRNLVREKYPHLENRSITKILGELWANLESSEKVTYTELAKQYKEAFMKANPDFKWYKLPSPTFRSSLTTRPLNQRQGTKLEVVPPSSSPQQQQSVASPCGVPLFKLADEAQMGGLNSLINPSSKAPSSPNLISKPPKKRYLENGAFRSQSFDEANNSAADLTASASASDCSALLKLAEMCSHELVKSVPTPASGSMPVIVNGHTLGSSGNNMSSSSSAAPVTTTMPSSSSSSSSSPPTTLNICNAPAVQATSPDYGLTDFGKLMANAMRANLAATGGRTLLGGNLNLFSSSLNKSPAGQDTDCALPGKGAVGDDQPLDLCTEKTITTSHQELIDCIVDTLCRDNEAGTSGGTSSKPPFPSSRLPKGIQAYRDGGGKNRIAARSPGDQEKQGDRSTLSLPLKKTKGARAGDASSASSPGSTDAGAFSDADDMSPRKSQRSCKGKRYQAMLSEGIIQPAKERKLSNTRKPSLGGDERMGECDEASSSTPPLAGTSPDSRLRMSSDSSEGAGGGMNKSESDVFYKANKTETMPSKVESSNPFHSSTTEPKMCGGGDYSESDKERSKKRFKTGDFDLDVHIAALPECNFGALDRRKQGRGHGSLNSAIHRREAAESKDEQSKINAGDNGGGVPSQDGLHSDDSIEGCGSSGSSSESHVGDSSTLVGSQKRKARKRSITHLDPVSSNSSALEAGVVNNFKLVALAEVCEERMSSGNNRSETDSTGSA